MKRQTPEGAVLKAVTDLLTAEGIWHMRCNTGTHVLEGANGKKRVFRAGAPGMADILALVPQVSYCKVCGGAQRPSRWLAGICRECDLAGPTVRRRFIPLWIEVKRPTGGKQSGDQQRFEAMVTSIGHAYLLVNDVQLLMDWLREHA